MSSRLRWNCRSLLARMSWSTKLKSMRGKACVVLEGHVNDRDTIELRCIMCIMLITATGNYHRSRLANFEADRPLLDVEHGVRIQCPTLFVRALGDDMIIGEIVSMMGVNVADLAIREVDAGHRLLWERPMEVNAFITEWMERQGLVSSAAVWMDETINRQATGGIVFSIVGIVLSLDIYLHLTTRVKQG